MQMPTPCLASSHCTRWLSVTIGKWELCKLGVGICIVMDEVGDAEPRVRRVLPKLPPIPVPVWLTTHREIRTSRRIRVVFDILAQELSRSAVTRKTERRE